MRKTAKCLEERRTSVSRYSEKSARKSKYSKSSKLILLIISFSIDIYLKKKETNRTYTASFELKYVKLPSAQNDAQTESNVNRPPLPLASFRRTLMIALLLCRNIWKCIAVKCQRFYCRTLKDKRDFFNV